MKTIATLILCAALTLAFFWCLDKTLSQKVTPRMEKEMRLKLAKEMVAEARYRTWVKYERVKKGED